MHGLAALLPDRLQRHERPLRGQSGFLAEFAKRAGEEIVRPHQSFGNGPGAGVLARPERAARMRQQEFDSSRRRKASRPALISSLRRICPHNSGRAADQAALQFVAAVLREG